MLETEKVKKGLGTIEAKTQNGWEGLTVTIHPFTHIATKVEFYCFSDNQTAGDNPTHPSLPNYQLVLVA